MEEEMEKMAWDPLIGETCMKEAGIDEKEGKKRSSHASIWEHQQDA